MRVFLFLFACLLKPVQAIQPRVIETTQKTTKGIEALQKQLTTNPSFTPRIVCPPFVQNALPYSVATSSNSINYGIPMLSPIQQMYPLHQTVLLNPYLPPMQTSFLKHFPTIDEEISERDTRKFSSLNTRAIKKLPQFQSMRLLKKRNIERFYPNTEYGDNFTEINNNKNLELYGDKETEDNIYENFPSILKENSNISGVEQFENLTDSIQVYEESATGINLSTNSLNRPVPAPRTKISPFNSPVKTDHVYVNLSMPIINTKMAKSTDIVDAPVRPTRSVENIKSFFDNDLQKYGIDDDDGEESEIKTENVKPNIVGATPKRKILGMLPSTSLVKSVVNQLNDQGINKVGLPKKQVISPNKTLQIPKLSEKPVPKRSVVRRSNSVQSSLALDRENGQV